MTLTQYRCGHIGKKVEGKNGSAFIRVAEIRNNQVWPSPDTCPNCGKGGHE